MSEIANRQILSALFNRINFYSHKEFVSIIIFRHETARKFPGMQHLQRSLFYLLLVTATGLNISWLMQTFPYQQPVISDETRQALGCLDRSSSDLVGYYRHAVMLKYDPATEVLEKLHWLRKINEDAGQALMEVSRCQTQLERHSTEKDFVEQIGGHLSPMIDAYEAIFLGEAVGYSRQIRNDVGLEDDVEKASSVTLPGVDSSFALKQAEDRLEAISHQIAAIVAGNAG